MMLNAYCLDWHLSNSGAFGDLLVEPLKQSADIKLTAWDGEKLPAATSREKTVIFCMLPPGEKFLKEYKGKIVWLPMWDQAQGYDQAWWNRLPKNVHIVSFSEQVCAKANAAGLPLLQLKYYKDPATFKPVSWQAGRVIFYWNRTGLIGPKFLEQLCRSLQAKKLIFRGQIDPRIDKNVSYKLPDKFGETIIESVSMSSQEVYIKKLDEANIFIAPRKNEGVGMTFIEALAKGCCVISYDAPTMNEYIHSGGNGILLRNHYPSFIENLMGKRPTDTTSGTAFHLSDTQPWEKIAGYDFESLGSNARQDAEAGFKTWQTKIDDYANFMLGR